MSRVSSQGFVTASPRPADVAPVSTKSEGAAMQSGRPVSAAMAPLEMKAHGGARGVSAVALRASAAVPRLRELAPALPAETLRQAHAASLVDHPVTEGKQLEFVGVPGQSVYNPTAPFEMEGRKVIAARVEDPHDELASNVMFFHQSGSHQWTLIADAPVFAMQDPCVTKIGGELVLGGVQTYPREAPGTGTGYRQVFFKASSLAGLKSAAADMQPFCAGPNDMKDVRLLELPSGEIFVLLRPQGTAAGNTEDAGRGKISWGIVPSVDALSDPKTIKKLVNGQQLDQFVGGEWGGSNELHLLPDGRIGVLGHIAKWSNEGLPDAQRHYYACAFSIDLARGEVSPMKILLERTDIDPERLGGAFKPGLWDVLFSGGVELHGDGTATLTVGAGDKEVWSARIADPYTA